jgi:hypothetical protein
MNAVWTFFWKISLAVNVVFDGVHALFGGWSLYPISALTGILMLLIFKATSKQSAIKVVKDRMKGGILEMRLYKDDIRVMAFATLKLLWFNVRYAGHVLPPLLVMTVPVVLIMVQLDARYGRQGYKPGERHVLTVEVKELEGNPRDPRSLSMPKMVVVSEEGGAVVPEVYPVRIPALKQTSWRLLSDRPGIHRLKVTMLDEKDGGSRVLDEVEIPFVVTDKVSRLQTVRRASVTGFGEAILEPGGPPIPRDSKFASISVRYPRREVSFFGWETSWIWPFIIVSIVVGFAFKGIFKVQI